MTTGTRGVSVPAKLRHWARNNRDVAADLPTPDEGEWVASRDFTEATVSTLRQLHRHGLIEPVGKTRLDPSRMKRSKVNVWMTCESVYRSLEKDGFFDLDREGGAGVGGVCCPACGEWRGLDNIDGERLRCKGCEGVSHKELWR